jgi:hypothetical protein
MSNLFASILSSALVSTSVTTALVWVSKTWISQPINKRIEHEYSEKLKAIEHKYNEKLETHRATLKAQSDVETERLKTELRRVAYQQEITFQKLHAERIKAVKDLYYKLLGLIKAIFHYVDPSENYGGLSHGERQKIVGERSLDFIDHFERNAILLSDDVESQIRTIIKELQEPTVEFGVSLSRPVEPAELAKRLVVWRRIWQSLNKTSTITKDKLKRELRQILGT